MEIILQHLSRCSVLNHCWSVSASLPLALLEPQGCSSTEVSAMGWQQSSQTTLSSSLGSKQEPLVPYSRLRVEKRSLFCVNTRGEVH